MGNVTWNGEAFMEHLNADVDRRLGNAAAVVAVHMYDLIQTPYPPASKPGESPHRRSGKLSDSVRVVKPAPMVRQIGAGGRDVGVPYARRLEVTLKRPYVLKALMESKETIKAAMAENLNAGTPTGN